MATFTVLSIVVILLGFLLWSYIHVPWDFPRELPRIPIYVSLLGLWSDMGQDEIYERWLRKPLEKHGAIIIWFAGRWNILVTRPEYLTDMFRNENIYAKAGSQVKIPWSVIAALVGDNIINSHGETWRLYTGIMKPGMQKKDFDTEPMLNKSRRLVDLFLDKQCDAEDKALGIKGGVAVNSYIQKWAIDVMGQSFLDYDFKVIFKRFSTCHSLLTAISVLKPPTYEWKSYRLSSRELSSKRCILTSPCWISILKSSLHAAVPSQS
jgi:unspecific monooxygenase